MDVVAVLSSLGSLALLGWIVIAVIQLRLQYVQRREEIVLRLYEPLLSEPLTRAYWRVQTWPYADHATFVAGATLEDRVAFDQVATFYETMGVMHHRGIASLQLLDELLTESVFEAWDRCRPIVVGERERTGTPQKYVWFEELVRLLEAHLAAKGVARPRVVVEASGPVRFREP
jgi:hypothetical protein